VSDAWANTVQYSEMDTCAHANTGPRVCAPNEGDSHPSDSGYLVIADEVFTASEYERLGGSG
jgi:hypothetical protein